MEKTETVEIDGKTYKRVPLLIDGRCTGCCFQNKDTWMCGGGYRCGENTMFEEDYED